FANDFSMCAGSGATGSWSTPEMNALWAYPTSTGGSNGTGITTTTLPWIEVSRTGDCAGTRSRDAYYILVGGQSGVGTNMTATDTAAYFNVGQFNSGTM